MLVMVRVCESSTRRDDWKISGHSPWNLPHMSKIMRTTEDMKTFVKTMIDYKKK